ARTATTARASVATLAAVAAMPTEFAIVAVTSTAALPATLSVSAATALATFSAPQRYLNFEIELIYLYDEKRRRICTRATFVACPAVHSGLPWLSDLGAIIVDPIAIGILAVKTARCVSSG